MEYTKGPWEWVPDTWNGGYSGIVGKDNAEVLYPNHCNDGDDGAAWFDEFPSEADRNLIAAAPDMYEALKDLQEQIPVLYGDQIKDGLITLVIESDTIDNIMKAIAKAEGGAD